MRDVSRKIEKIKLILYKYASSDDIRTSNGNLFVAPVGHGELNFLHKIFLGCSKKEINKISHLIGFDLPCDYEAFLEFTDGAICFDNTLSIYGLNSNLCRSTYLNDQGPHSLEREINIQNKKGVHDYVSVGSVSTANLLFNLQINKEGTARFGRIDSGFIIDQSFLTMLETLFVLIDNLSNRNGLNDDSGFELENEIIAALKRT